jgi:hypothetical protein
MKKNLPNFKWTRSIICFLLFNGMFISQLMAGATCADGEWNNRWYEKMDAISNVSYNFLIPLGKWGKCGNFRGAGYTHPGHGVDAEFLQYFVPGSDDNVRLAIGASDQLFFFPLCADDLNHKLDDAFAYDTIAHTQYKTPEFNCWKAFGICGQFNALYMWDEFSIEGTLKAGPMCIIPPSYATFNGNYVPPEYSYLFEGQLKKEPNTWTYYFHLGVNASWYFSEHFGVFAGGGFSYTRPIFKNELMNIHMENGNAVIEREKVSIAQSMPFLQLRAGVTFHLGKWD